MKTRTLLAATIAATALADSALGQAYTNSWQYKYGGDATFFVEGPATGDNPDVEGDADAHARADADRR